jgi:thiamine biosynthesis lipoprotein
MRRIFALAEQTRLDTFGYFDIRRPDGTIDPSGLVKGWAISEVARLLGDLGCRNYFVDAGGDVQTRGRPGDGEEWSVGIQNPFDPMAMVKVVYPHGGAVATSGNYVRGAHIYDPLHPGRLLIDLASITVIGSDIYDADRYATAAFAMGAEGIRFVDGVAGLEGYAIDSAGIATMTSGFGKYATPC